MSTPSGDERTVEFDSTNEDYLAMLRDMFLNEPFRYAEAIRQRRTSRYLALAIYGLAAALIYPALSLNPGQSIARNLVIFVMLMIAWGAHRIWISSKSPESMIDTFVSTFRERISKGELRPLTGHRIVTVNRDGVHIVTTMTQFRMSWACVARIVSDKSHLFVFTHFNEGWAIPRAAFASAADADHFLDFAKALHDSSEGSVRVRLAHSDEPCFACGYNLRGSDGQVCPECGVRLLLSRDATGPTLPMKRDDETASR